MTVEGTDGRAELWAAYKERFGAFEEVLKDDYLDAPQPVPTGIGFVDAVTNGGLRPGLHLLAGGTGAGKSAFSLCVAARMAAAGTRVLYVTLEMSRGQCYSRLASLRSTGSDMDPFRWSDWERMAREAKGRLGSGDDTPDAAQLALRAVFRDWPGLVVAHDSRLRDAGELYEEVADASASGCGAVFVDYLQLVGDQGASSEYERVSSVSGGLAAVAVDCGIPVLAISSVSRAKSKSAVLDQAAFKGSGNLEYDAVSAWALCNPGDNGDGTRSIDLVCTKNRFGPFDPDGKKVKREFVFQPEYSVFQEPRHRPQGAVSADAPEDPDGPEDC